MSVKKPPLGITPRYIWEENRVLDLIQAIERCLVENKSIPIEWIEEYNEWMIKKQGE